MYKLIASDLDETLLKLDRTISEEDKEAIRWCRENGIYFVPATGRGYNSVQGTLQELDLYDLKDQYVISYNGGAVTENNGNRLLHFEGISFELAEVLVQKRSCL